MIVGRQVEQKILLQFIARTRAKKGSTLVIVGEPGMGKTTMLDWTASRARNASVLRVVGHESESDLPFVSLSDLLRPIESEVARLPPHHRKTLRATLSPGLETGGDRLAIDTAVLSLLRQVATDRPVLLVIDDYQWLDTASRSVVDYLARRSVEAGVGLLMATRGPATPDHGGTQIDLPPLTDAAAAELVKQAAKMRPDLAQRVIEMAAGNPLALVELPSALSNEELDGEAWNASSIEVSATLDLAFRNHLDRLSDGARLAVLCIAEEGSGDLGVVHKAASSLGITSNDIDEAVTSGLIVEDGSTARFRHPLVRSVAHASAAPHLIRAIHAVYASTVTDDDHRAWHLAGAAIGVDEMAADALEGMASRALARGAAASAATALAKAANLGAVEERYRRLVAAARAAHRSGNMPMTGKLIQQARSVAGPSTSDPALVLLEADLLMRKGNYAQAYGTLRLEGVGIAPSDPHRAATMLMVAAKMRVFGFEGAAALDEVERALSLIPEGERDAVHHASLAMARTMAGHPEARSTARLAAELATAAPLGHIHSLGIAWPLIWLEEYELAAAFLNRSARIQTESGFIAYLPLSILPLAELEYRTGQWDSARQHIQEAIHLLEESDQPTEASIALALLARIEAASGDVDAGRSHALAAGQGKTTLELGVSSMYSRAVLGFLELGLGNNQDAIEHLEWCWAEAKRGGTAAPWILTSDADLAEALIRAGDRERGLEIASSLLASGEEANVKWAVAAAKRCMGLAERGDGFRDTFDQAIGAHRQLANPFELARTELAYGERLRRAKSRADARRVLRRALTTFERLGASTWADRARFELEVSGETMERSYSPFALTRQERRVASIVAAGATNQEAAATLFINRKTIEFHLANVYRKLGVRSRTELANALRPDE